MAKVLQMSFLTGSGRSRTIRVNDAKGTVTGGEVSGCMNNIITKNIFSGAGGELTAKQRAQMVTTTIEEIILD